MPLIFLSKGYRSLSAAERDLGLFQPGSLPATCSQEANASYLRCWMPQPGAPFRWTSPWSTPTSPICTYMQIFRSICTIRLNRGEEWPTFKTDGRERVSTWGPKNHPSHSWRMKGGTLPIYCWPLAACLVPCINMYNPKLDLSFST